MSEGEHIGTYWIVLANDGEPREDVAIYADGIGGSLPSVTREQGGIRFQRAGGGFTFLPWSSVRRIDYIPAEELRKLER